MCGICGFISFHNKNYIDKATLTSMNDIMKHRGPDDEGVYLGMALDGNKFRIGLGHRRLSIIDLSTHGHQPMSNEDGSVWIVYNGEVYNFVELKNYLIKKGHVFKSHSDTEVIVHLYEDEGENCVNFLRGMFSFAIWDNNKRTLFAARDRLGVKPFYYYLDHDMLIFASEAKAILKSKKVSAQVNKGVIDAYLTLGYVPAPQTMFKGINKLQPGCSITCRAEQDVVIKKYWDIDKIHVGAERTEKQYIDEFRSILEDCVRMRLISDVPLGVFLSGGVDSSAVVGLMSKMSSGLPVKTFCVGYKDKQSSELEYARIIAQRFKTEHHEFCLEPSEFYKYIPKIVWHFDEPVVEAAAIPLYFISKLAREYVTVLLSGEGADELFAGYPIYKYMGLIEKYRKVPKFLRKTVMDHGIGLAIKSQKKKNKYLAWTDLPLNQRYFGVSTEITSGFKKSIFSHNYLNDNYKEEYIPELLSEYYHNVEDRDSITQMLYLDTKVWLPDDLLVKADKMSMAASVELRVPFLDYKLVEFAMSVPSRYKIKGWTNKYLLKKSMEDLLPKEIIYRKKRGFPVPLSSWFKNELSSNAADILLDPISIKRDYFNSDSILSMINGHKNGIDDYSKMLFSLVNLEMWHNIFIDHEI